MIGYATLGTQNLARAQAFYDALPALSAMAYPFVLQGFHFADYLRLVRRADINALVWIGLEGQKNENWL